MTDTLVDRVYEAAFVPELWPAVLAEVGARSGSASGALQILRGGDPPLWAATDRVREALGGFIAAGLWRACERPLALSALDHPGFVLCADHLTPEQAARDPVAPLLDALGLGWQVGTAVSMPTGERVGLTFERRLGDGRHDPAGVAALDALRPHLARAALLAARLGLERARAAVDTLEVVGLPSAALAENGRAVAANALLERAPNVRLGAGGRTALIHPPAEGWLRAFLSGGAAAEAARSLPLPATEEAPAAIAHALPLRGAARGLLGGARNPFGAVALLVLTPVGLGTGAPDATLLRALFDLTPAEARLAAGLVAGRTLREIAEEAGVQVSTARSYLERVFQKTGARQQSQLVALLKSTGPLGER